jgi:hypothetical protein
MNRCTGDFPCVACLRQAAVTCALLAACLMAGAGCNESHSASVTSPASSTSPPQAALESGKLDAPSDGAQAAKEPQAPARTETPAARPTIKDITFDALKFDIKAGDAFERSMIPKATEELHGKPVRIRGFIYPQLAFTDTGLTTFILTRDNGTCCFGPNRALCDFVVVYMNPGKTADYVIHPIAVEGTFTIEELVDPTDPEGGVGAIYRLDADLAR